MKTLLCIVILMSALVSSFAGELRIIIAPRSTTLDAKGYISFDLYLYNDTGRPVSVPSPSHEFTTVWTVRDVDNVRQAAEDSHLVVGTDTVATVTIDPRRAVRCELGENFLTQPGDIVEFYVSIDAKSVSGNKGHLRSNTVALVRPKG
ncbi:MAG: hypothetical protein V7609_2622 [Verrucomicrobiota bacterium]